MPRYAIKQQRALHTVYYDCDDVLDAVNHARAALVDHAKHCELEILRLRDERDAESEARYEETEADRETERLKGLRMGLFGAESDPKELEPW